MTRDVIAGHPEDDVEDRFYFKHAYLPVVEDERAVGIIAIPDFVKTYHDHYKVAQNVMDSIINSSKNLIISAGPDARINLVNVTAQEVLEKSEEELLGRRIAELVEGVNLLDVIRTGVEPPIKTIIFKNHNYINRSYPIRHDSNIIGAVAILQDITDIENIVGELESVNELNMELDAIIESSSDGIFVCDGEANVLRINKAYDEITELNTSDFVGKNMRVLVENGVYSESVTLKVLDSRELVSIIQKTSTGKSLLATGKPVYDDDGNIFRVVTSVRDITELYSLQQRLEDSRKITEQYMKELSSMRLKTVRNIEGMIIGSEEMSRIAEMAMRIAKVDSTILITGESGTGKDLIAGIVHKYSSRDGKPFIKLNCGAIPENLLESELFGYEEGAFTGAKKGGKPGYFEMAEGGTLFLDEIGELPYALQAKFLRALQHKEFSRVGGHKFRSIDVRIVAATNRDLLDMVHEKIFREDLYYRLNVVPLFIPPLRERSDDVQFLVVHFLNIFNENYGMKKRLSLDVLDIFEKYSWPGNVRELRNLIERIVVMTPDDVITVRDLPDSFCEDAECADVRGIAVSGFMPLKEALEAVEKQLIKKAYDKYSTTRIMAEHLQISAASIVRKAAKYGIKKK